LTTAVYELPLQPLTGLQSRCWLGLQSCEGLNGIGESTLMAGKLVLDAGKKLQYSTWVSELLVCSHGIGFGFHQKINSRQKLKSVYDLPKKS